MAPIFSRWPHGIPRGPGTYPRLEGVLHYQSWCRDGPSMQPRQPLAVRCRPLPIRLPIAAAVFPRLLQILFCVPFAGVSCCQRMIPACVCPREDPANEQVNQTSSYSIPIPIYNISLSHNTILPFGLFSYRSRRRPTSRHGQGLHVRERSSTPEERNQCY